VQFRNLKEIEIDNNSFTEFPKELFQLENLEGINIADNRITTVPRDILKLRKLKNMDISNNLLTEFPSVLLELPDFVGLAMYNNRLTELPDDFDKLRKLKVLSLAGNYFTREQYREFNRQLPNRFVGGSTGDYDRVMFTYEEAQKHPDRVYLLSLDGMGLEFLPKDITTFKNLEVLNVNKNPLRALPKDLGKLKHLHFIYAYDTLLGDAAKKQLAKTNPKAKLYLGAGEGL
jgi:Leucine-rich repeat (LRR) protein